MAVPTNTAQVYQLGGTTGVGLGNREDLADMITRIDPQDTPFMSMIATKRPKISAVFTEWLTQTLDAVNLANAVIEGDDPAGDAVVAPVREKNSTQLSDKVAIVSSSQDTVSHAGRKTEIGYQVMLKSLSLKRDIEGIITQTQGRNAGAAGTARTTRALESWLITNVDSGAGYADGTDTTAPTDGTQRAFTETILKSVIKQSYNSGGMPDCLLLGPSNKQVLSTFSGNATRFQATVDKKLITTIDVYVSDFGELRAIPSRRCRDRTAFVLEKDKWGVGYLQGFAVEPLAKTGHSIKRLISAEYALIAYNEASSGKAADLTTP